jgi:hypothetical protein
MQLPEQASIAKGTTVGTAAYVLRNVYGQWGGRFMHTVYGKTATVPMFAALAAGAGSIVSDITHATLFS